MADKSLNYIIKQMKNLNPYPESVFTKPTEEEYILMREALRMYGLIPDRFFGSWGRTVWNNCVETMEELCEEENDR